jgi:hypothetical protein
MPVGGGLDVARRGWVVMLTVALFMGCLSSSPERSPTPMPTHTPLPARALLPTVTPTPLPVPTPDGLVITAAGVTYTSPRYGYAILLPPGWQAMAQIDAALESIHERMPALLVPYPFDETAGETLELIAALPDADNPSASRGQLTVMVLPRETLSLPAYLEQTAKNLSVVTAVHIGRAELDPTLRRDGLPVAVVEYTSTLAPDDLLAGCQATLIGRDPATLIVLTFTTRPDQYATLRPQFIQIARRVDLTPPHTP